MSAKHLTSQNSTNGTVNGVPARMTSRDSKNDVSAVEAEQVEEGEDSVVPKAHSGGCKESPSKEPSKSCSTDGGGRKSTEGGGREAWTMSSGSLSKEGSTSGSFVDRNSTRGAGGRGASVLSTHDQVLRGEGRGVQCERQSVGERPGGQSYPKRPLGCRLSKELWDKLENMFVAMDTDRSNFVSREEALHFFKGTFSKISADAMFKEIDLDHSGAITADEFMNFWVQVKKSGYSDEDIAEEIDQLLQGNAWVDWKDERNTDKVKVEEFPKRKMLCRISAETWVKCEALFREIDQDGSMQITRPKASKHFKGAFNKVSVEAFFNEVDTKGHGTIVPKDFMAFWVQVRNSGYKDKEIREEVELLLEGEPWRDWKDGRTT